MNFRVSRSSNFYQFLWSLCTSNMKKTDQKKLRKLTRVARNGIARIRLRGNKDRGKQFNMILQALNYFCTHTTLHGLRYVVDPELHVIGRFLWFIVFVVSSTIASNVIYSLANRFQVNYSYEGKGVDFETYI